MNRGNDQMIDLTWQEKHEVARTFAMSGSQSKFQKRKVEQKKSEDKHILKASSPALKKVPICYMTSPQ
jgi:hypothetical protein